MRKKKNLEARLARCAHLAVGQPEEALGHWRSLREGAFSSVMVELGCGKGSFIAGMAQRYPDVLFIGIERVPEALVMAMERIMDAKLSNVLFLDQDVTFLDKFFAPGEIDRLFINFCDPWPKKKQAERRLTHRKMLAMYRPLLARGAHIEFKSDNAPLFEFSLEEFPAAGYRITECTRDLHAQPCDLVVTEYEARFMAQGVPIKRCVAIPDSNG